MSDNKNQEQEFIKAFNQGYLISKHEPELANKLLEGLNDSSSSQGFAEGIKQAKIEKAKEYIPSFMKGKEKTNRAPDKTKDKDIERE